MADSQVAGRSGLHLSQFVRIYRHQTSSDSRPNKNLFELPTSTDPSLRDMTDRWNAIVREGGRPEWKPNKPHRQLLRPPNHKTINAHIQHVRDHICKGQRDGHYIRRIFELRTRFPGHPILMMLGDVSGAFRHIPLDADHVHMFAFRFEGYIVIDLVCGFGWCGSPAYCSVAGSLINNLYQNQQPERSLALLDSSKFTGNIWCDDHTCIEVSTGTRCAEANWALRKAMSTVLGPTSISEEKFTDWSTQLKALGLMWDTTSGTVAVPADKIIKARTSTTSLLASDKCTLSTIHKLLGSLRCISTCFPSARAFYQNVQAFATTFPHNLTRRQVVQYVVDPSIYESANIANSTV